MDAPLPPRVSVDLDDDHPDFADFEELVRLRQYEREHRVNTRLIAVLVERLLSVTGGDAIEVADTAITEARGLRAWRDPDRKSVLIAVE